MVKVGIIGGAGYTAGELIRLLINHPKVEIAFVYSTSNAGNRVGDVHQDLAWLDLKFTDYVQTDVDVVFLCLGHGNSGAFLKKHSFSDGTKIIDLSNEFRLKEDAHFLGKDFVYGLPELNKEAIKKAQNIVNPGCFATAIQLALLPLAQSGKLTTDVHVNAVTGATGAGTSPSATSHFPWRDNNFSHYKAFNHQHLGEIGESVKQLQNDFDKEILFIPNRGDFSRGIFATAYTDFDETLEEAYELYNEFYQGSPFTKVNQKPLHLKQVVNTNYCFIHLEKHGNKLLITSILDNLLKGASGQAVENMNLMFGWEQTEGLKLKANYF
ncbi:N-acetyl-gamma-glutamyl-phosphate reductase [Dokdonia sinensis]|uniref:N-acetyl-gamma-glutamyl-phosphate reductase n=1 Tax=Dokdonia sinensis TaxID=2479847 RepID=A0A3M0GHY2_9FLAO|nr:N-acetyl-gamma-glutamyl-phosphate reductase [Dokdonia sinensis]RMB56946.1 N-acetyl-gamma-glutamyl-phosphate reductase [Dokdonia sinensis]